MKEILKAIKVNIWNLFSQDSFELPRGQSSRDDGDIEMGRQGPSSAELGLEGFFKQVMLKNSNIWGFLGKLQPVL